MDVSNSEDVKEVEMYEYDIQVTVHRDKFFQ